MGRRLDRVVTVLARQTETTATGNKRNTGEVELLTVPASYEPLSDGERWRAGAVEQKADARFVLRYSARAAAITSEHFLRINGADWEITGTKEIGRRRWVEITALKSQ
ncbi:phage head closure protein [Tritonibacter scottomollicae]|uniref:SPP1 family predicted phage head-tail adaptor n=1 Tax=Tritonibacter scottomollicae TaxID=483013 RepID=A0A2T1AJA3_TRISK|nr:phage head closure protein [Tritonibacter scottomollicae]PRZ48695.1 SPP1 family predicted phage head-tail adaptor [Tritonibacter scottomollicae]